MYGAKAALEDYRRLERIVAMLIALAALAERAGGASRPVRCLVLWILRPAGAAALAFVAEITQSPHHAGVAFAAAPMQSGESPNDALRLAQHFRALAAALSNLLYLISRFASSSRRIDPKHIREIAMRLAWASAKTPPASQRQPYDTS